jgi:TfoX/Sxy family transcriptional regulator of competence genes
MESTAIAAGELFESVVGPLLEDPRVTRSTMFGARGLRIGGKVFAMLAQDRLVVKLPRARVEALASTGAGARFDPGHGRLMKEWVGIPPTSADDWSGLLREAREFVGAGR